MAESKPLDDGNIRNRRHRFTKRLLAGEKKKREEEPPARRLLAGVRVVGCEPGLQIRNYGGELVEMPGAIA